MEMEHIASTTNVCEAHWQPASHLQEAQTETCSSMCVNSVEGIKPLEASNNLAGLNGPKENSVIVTTASLYHSEDCGSGPQIQNGSSISDGPCENSQAIENLQDVTCGGDLTLGFITNKDSTAETDCVSWTKITLMPSGLGVNQEHRPQLLAQQSLPVVNIVDRGTQTVDNGDSVPSTPPECLVSVATDRGIQRQMRLLGRMWELRQTGTMCDLTLEADDGSLRVHSVVLAASSPSLLAMCCQHAGSPGCVRLPGVCFEDCAQAVRYIYTGYLGVTHSQTAAFLDLCKKWDLTAAFEFCQLPLIERTSLEHVVPEGNGSHFRVQQHKETGRNNGQEVVEDADQADCYGQDPVPESVKNSDQRNGNGQCSSPPKQDKDDDPWESDGLAMDPDWTQSTSQKLSVSATLRPRALSMTCRTRSVTKRLLWETTEKISEVNGNCTDKGPTTNVEECTALRTLARTEAEVPVKRKRGRPRKRPISAESVNGNFIDKEPTTNMEECAAISNLARTEAKAAVPVKRKRGRPRKHPISAESGKLENGRQKHVKGKMNVKGKAMTSEATDSGFEIQNVEEPKESGIEILASRHQETKNCGLSSDLWTCTKCKESFETKAEMQGHNRKHREEEHHMYICDKCGKAFTERNNKVT